MAKGKRKKHRKGGKITFGRTMAAGGEFTSSVGVIISWIIGILMALTGIYLILAGSFGRFDIFDSGQCQAKNPLPSTCSFNSSGECTSKNPSVQCENINGLCDDVDPCSSYSKKSCKGAKVGVTCEYRDSGTYSTGVRVMYIIGGLLTILFGVGIIMLSYWFRGAVHRNKNMAAFAGGLGIINAAGAAFGPRN